MTRQPRTKVTIRKDGPDRYYWALRRRRLCRWQLVKEGTTETEAQAASISKAVTHWHFGSSAG